MMWRVLGKELQEMLASTGMLVGLLGVPCIVLFVLAALPMNQDRFRIYVEDRICGIADEDGDVREEPCALPTPIEVRHAVGDLPGVELVEAERGETPIWDFIDRNNLDAAFIWHGTVASLADQGSRGRCNFGSWTEFNLWSCADALYLDYPAVAGAWHVYTDPLHQQHARNIELFVRMAQADSSALALAKRMHEMGSASIPVVPSFGLALPASDAAISLGQSQESFVGQFVVTARSAPSTRRSDWLVPGLMALMACFVAFALGAVSIVREVEQGTMGHLVVGAGGGWAGVAAAKTLFSFWFGLLALGVMAVFAHLALDITIKPGLGWALGLQTLAVLASALQGLAISSIVGSVRTALFVSAAYMAALTLFSGVLMPISGAAQASFIHVLLPASFSHSAWTDWLLKGAAPSNEFQSLWPLAALAVGSLLAAALGVARLARRI
jgi:hypothetical protein